MPHGPGQPVSPLSASEKSLESARGGDMADTTNRRLAITLEISGLSPQQIKAIEDATFMGWTTEEEAAYEERGRRIATLRTELLQLEGLDQSTES
jgi:hypothetical protein